MKPDSRGRGSSHNSTNSSNHVAQWMNEISYNNHPRKPFTARLFYVKEEVQDWIDEAKELETQRKELEVRFKVFITDVHLLESKLKIFSTSKGTEWQMRQLIYELNSLKSRKFTLQCNYFEYNDFIDDFRERVSWFRYSGYAMGFPRRYYDYDYYEHDS